MPKSKKNRIVPLTQTHSKGKAGKDALIQDIRECLENFKYCYVFSLENVRSTFLSQVREKWRSSRIFMGKKKVMQVALGRSVEDEYKPNLHKYLVGECGLFLTNEDDKDVLKFFREYREADYARSGFNATETVQLEAGPLAFAHSMEPYLRNELGMPTSLKNGVVTLEKSFTVCTEGETITPQQARILQLLDTKMSEFKLTPVCVWSEGKFKKF